MNWRDTNPNEFMTLLEGLKANQAAIEDAYGY